MKRILIFSLACVFSFAVIAQTSPTTNPNAPVITFDKKLVDKAGNITWDYGTVIKDGNGDSYFAFVNTGKEPLVLSEVRSSCGCTVPRWPREPIMPGKGDTIKVRYTTSRMGVINKSITVISNAVNNPVILRIAGNVVDKPVEVLPEKQTTGAAQPVNKK